MNKKHKISHGRKFSQVVEGAKDIFLRDGYAGASVDEIAKAAAVSKATLYSYFPDKKLMFEEAARAEIGRLGEKSPISVPPGTGVTEGVALIARQIAGWITRPASVRLYRVQVAEATRFPEISEEYQRMKHRLLRDPVRPLLQHWADNGELEVDDSQTAADQLIALAGAAIHDAASLGKRDAVSDADLNHTAKQAAAVFLRAYAPTVQTTRRSTAAR